MAKGAKKKTKWVSLSLANANTKTSNAAGSDSEQTSNHHLQQQHHHGEGHKNKMQNGASFAAKLGKDVTARVDVIEEEKQQQQQQQHGNERVQDHSGHRTDTSTGSDCVMGSDRRPVSSYHRRRPPPYNSSRTWSGGASAGSNHGRGGYHRNGGGYYGNGGGYYGTGKRSHYDSYTRRQQTTASTNRTTSGEGGETGGTTINDDEYTRITTPRQDVLFKKGYLSRPKPSVATASTSNTGSSSLAGTTSEGSDGGNGGSNSISTTESITSEYGGSYAADGSPLLDYSIPIIPCGYFTESGVLVMNGFAVDNNGFSYFNGGQTYIYPPNYNNCQPESPTTTTAGGDDQQTTDSMLYANDNAIDETNANESTDQDRTQQVCDSESTIEYQEVSGGAAYAANSVDTGTNGQFYPNGALPSIEQQVVVPLCEVVQEQVVPNGEQLAGEVTTVDDGSSTVCEVSETQDYSDNGFFPYTNGYDFAQFYNSLCYPNWYMDQCMYDDNGLPLYYGGEYAMTNEEGYGHQPSFKKRKKRFRTFEEMPSTNGNSYDVGNATSSVVLEPNATGSELTECVPENQVPSTDAHHQAYQLNAEVQEFQPSVLPDANPLPNVAKIGEAGKTSNVKADHSAKGGHTQVQAKNRTAGVPKVPKSSSKVMATVPVDAVQTNPATTVSPVPVGGKPTSSKANRKKDLIESTLAFAAQNIDLTRPKAATASICLESELCWTTVDRNGRKKRVEPEQNTATANGVAEKQSAADEGAKENLTKPSEPVQPVTPTQVSVTLTIECPTVPDVSGKKEQQSKSKKKTHKHKRQQLRKSVGNNKQPLEGFQLIEPEFSSSSAGHRRGRSGDKAGRVEAPKAPVEEVQIVKDDNKQSVASLERIVSTDESCRVVEELPQTIKDDMNCDKESNDVPAEASPTEELAELVEIEEEEIVAQTVIPSLSAEVTVEEETDQNETETEKHHQPSSSVDVEEPLQEEKQAPQAEVIEQEEVVQVEAMEDTLQQVEQEVVHTTQEPTKVDSSSVPSQRREENLLSEETNGEEQQEADVQLSIDTNVLTTAAKHLTSNSIASPKLPTLEEGDVEDDQADVADDGIGSEGDDTRPKRGSVSGAGYTESIDSGLQSPAPCCGGVASPETSSMVSSIESQPTGVDASQSALTQIVGSWLLQKLEVHEPEEVFVLPSNPLLIQRLQRFHQLQRRERLRGAITSESEGEDDEYDLDGEDTDSDYMSDGQGRLDRTQSDDANSSNPGSPLNSTQQGTGIGSKTLLNGAQTGTQPVLEQNSGGLNSNATLHRAADAKRCSIM